MDNMQPQVRSGANGINLDGLVAGLPCSQAALGYDRSSIPIVNSGVTGLDLCSRTTIFRLIACRRLRRGTRGRSLVLPGSLAARRRSGADVPADQG